MDTFRKITAGVCAVLFVISGVIALLAFNIEGKAFTSATYKQAFENQNLFVRIPKILANALYTSNAENVNADPYLKALSVGDWEATITSLLPPEELKTITANTLDAIFDYLNGNTDSAVISILPIKKQLAGDSGLKALNQILHAQPDCTAEQLLQLGLGLFGGDIALCNPPEELMGLMTPLIESQLQVMTIAFPDEVTLISGARSDTPDDPRPKLDRVRTLMKITPVFPLLFLFILTIFAVRSLMDWLRWWGWPFLITGGVTSLIALLGAPVLALIFQAVLKTQGPNFIPTILISTMSETVGAVTGQILEPVAIEGLVLAILGLGMVIVAAYLVRKDSTPRREVAKSN